MSDQYLQHLPEDADEATKEAFKVLMFVAIAQGVETVDRDWVVGQLEPVREYREVVTDNEQVDVLTQALRAALEAPTRQSRLLT